MRRNWIFFAPLVVVAVIVFGFIGGQVVRELWNWLLPPLFGWPTITFWQALGLLALCRILFGGLGRGGSSHSSIRTRRAERIADRVGDRWDAMTPDERERFRHRIRERCGFDPSSSDSHR